ncbi:glycolate oxidase subunit GlcE [Paraburkholderia kururiensis]|uniref:glycolate oxidase subunit GlcE n=1 Tax=Paraburkholderia kururiensis TaxID=984307 RepID=UPI00034DE93F|nr:glycolate oxidase subunit GlcE [Paraburkholderia kururiensis]
MRRELDSMDNSAALIAQVEAALAARTPVRIRGGDSKAWLGRAVAASHGHEVREIDTRGHRGIVHYDPTELVMTVRTGTPLADVEAVLNEAGQMLPFEAPLFGGAATVGGMLAAGLSGARRPWVGAVRDYVLGCRVITGHARHLRFGGEVMKNVAGYDVSRLMAGSFGCLGLVTEVSFKVLPQPRATRHLALELAPQDARQRLFGWRRDALPITGACYAQGVLQLRLEGGTGSVRAAREAIGGADADAAFWTQLRDFTLPFFADERPLWRLSLPAGVPLEAPLAALPGDALLDWGGAQRWLKTTSGADDIRSLARELGGHATAFTQGVTDSPFQPLPDALMQLHRRLKAQLDPQGIFNPGRLYADL